MLTAEQRERRKTGIYASDVARIMSGEGVQLTLEKLGHLEPDDLDGQPHVELGNVLESYILDAYELLVGREVVRSPDTMMHPSVPWLGAHLDAWAPPEVVVECKAYTQMAAECFGEEGSDFVPPKIMWQVQAQMAASGAQRADIPVCFTDNDALTSAIISRTVPIKVYVVNRSDEMIAYLIERCAEVWQCIETSTLPVPVEIGDVALIYRKASEDVVVATDAQLIEHHELLYVRAQIKQLVESEKRLKDSLQRFMGDASVLMHDGETLVTWKQTKDKKRFAEYEFAKENPELYAQYMRTTDDSRQFLPKDPNKGGKRR